MKRKSKKRKKSKPINSSIIDKLRQLSFQKEFRIDLPEIPLYNIESHKSDEIRKTKSKSPDKKKSTDEDINSVFPKLVLDLGTCLWYLKTRFYKRVWEDDSIDDEDPKARRALGRINKCIEVLKEKGIDIQDPINRRYPPGGEGLMRPVQFLPTDGITYEMVSETVTPIIYYHDRLLQRGEVFVLVPREKPETGKVKTQKLKNTPDSSGAIKEKEQDKESVEIKNPEQK